MIAYRYDEQGIFVGQEEAFIDPLESKKAGKDIFVLPADCTFTAPGKDKDGFVQAWDGNGWEYVENHKGKFGYLGGKPFEMKQYGPLPDDFTETPPPPTDEELADKVRAERNAKLAKTDKYLMPDFPIGDNDLQAVKDYRKALRDVPAQAGFPHDVKWPENPME